MSRKRTKPAPPKLDTSCSCRACAADRRKGTPPRHETFGAIADRFGVSVHEAVEAYPNVPRRSP